MSWITPNPALALALRILILKNGTTSSTICVSLYSGTLEGGEELGTIPGFEIWGEYGLSKNAAVRGSYLSLDPLADTPLDPWVDASWNVGHLDLQLKLADNLAVFGGLQFQSLWIENERFYKDTGGEVGLLANVPLNLATEFYGTLALASIEGDRFTDLGLGLDIRVSPAVYLGLAYKRILGGWNGISGNLTYRF